MATLIKTSNIDNLAVTHDKLHTDMDLTTKTVQVATPTANSHPATKDYVDTEVANLIDSAPGALDTLNELAAAIGDDANFAATISTNIGTKVDKINITGATVGSSSQVPVITFNSQGQITSASSTAVAGVSSTAYSTSTGVLTINTSDGGSFTEDLGVGTSDSPTFASGTTVRGSFRVTETGTAQTILIGNQDSGGLNKPSMIMGVNGSLRLGYGDSWVGEGGTMTTGLMLDSNNNVGIGTTSPLVDGSSKTLEISNAVTARVLVDTTSGSGRRWGMYTTSADGRLGFYDYDAGANRLVIDPNGNVGIGTTSPQAGFQVMGPATATVPAAGSGAVGGAIFSADLNTYGMFIGSITSGDGYIQQQRTNTATYYNLALQPNGGNVGIGTPNPTTKLHVNGNIRASTLYQEGGDSASSAMVVSQGVNTTRASVAMWPKDHGSYPGQVHIVSHSANASVDSGKIMFWDYNGSTWNANGAWDKDGKLGIGTTNPTHKLEVFGTATDGSELLHINSNGNVADGGYHWMTSAIAGSQTTNANIVHMIGKELAHKNAGYFGFHYAGDHSDNNFVTIGGYAADQLLNIKMNGNVGIGTTSPQGKLHVDGSAILQNGTSDPTFFLYGRSSDEHSAIRFASNTGTVSAAILHYNTGIYFDGAGANLNNAGLRIFSDNTVDINGPKLNLPTATSNPSSPIAGSSYFNTNDNTLKVYDGANWGSVVFSALGTEQNPASSAEDILAEDPSASDGLYWFKPAGYTGSPFQVYCDMTNYGGGWMIVSKWYQDSPYTVDEIYNANARNANTTYLLNATQPTAKSTHSRLSRDQTNALWNSSNHIARIWTTDGGGGSGSPLGTYFQKKITNTTNFDFWNAHYSALMWSDQITANTSYIQYPGTTYKVMRYETSGNVFTDGTFTDFTQPSVGNGPGYWDNITVNAPNYGNVQATRHMGFYGDIYEGNQWLLTNNPNDSRFTSQDSSEGKRSVVYLK